MVNTALLGLVVITLLLWLAHHFLLRKSMIQSEETLPSWYVLSSKGLGLLWIAWGIMVFKVKDGDFAVVMVTLTLLTGFVVLVEKLVFSRPASTDQNSNDSAMKAVAPRDFIVAEYSKSFFPVLFVVLILRSFVIEPFQIPSSSMVPTLEIGDYILVSKFSYGIRLPVVGTKIIDVGKPKRGDVMVFFPPHDKRYFIKRVIGLPGDVISYTNKRLTINGKPVPEKLLAEFPVNNPVILLAEEDLEGVRHEIHKDYLRSSVDFTIKIEPGFYYMMGDNRDNSSDSRFWGPVPEKNVVGKAFAVWMHWKSFKELPSFKRVGAIQ